MVRITVEDEMSKLFINKKENVCVSADPHNSNQC